MRQSDDFRRASLYFEEIRKELENRGVSMSGPATVRRKFRTLVKLAGTKATQRVVTELQDALADSGVFADPPIGRGLRSLDSWIELSITQAGENTALFAYEKDLVAFVEHTIGTGVFGDLAPFMTGRRRSCREHRLPDKRRLDLLCEERSYRGSGALVVIELKRAHDRGAVAQMVGYLKALKRQYPNRKVRGIIVAGRTDETTSDMVAAITDFRIDLVVYDVRFHTIGVSGAQLSPSAGSTLRP